MGRAVDIPAQGSLSPFDDLLPFILYYEAGLPGTVIGHSADLLYRRATATGFANDPDDAGGPTLCGVTLATYRSHTGRGNATIADLRSMDFDCWRRIVRRLYWQRWQADRLPTALAWLLVDWVWASGVWGIKHPQRVLGVEADGIVGDKTLAAVRAANPDQLFEALHARRVQHVHQIVEARPAQRKFLRGWLRRINAITPAGLIFD